MQLLFQKIIKIIWSFFYQMISKIIDPLIVGFFDTNICQFPYLMHSPWSQLDPCTPPNNYQILHLNKPHLNWSWFFWSTTFLTILPLGSFLSWLTLPTSCSLDNNQNSKYLEQKKTKKNPWLILFHLLISVYHACFNNSHNSIWRQNKHYALYSKPWYSINKRTYL